MIWWFHKDLVFSPYWCKKRLWMVSEHVQIKICCPPKLKTAVIYVVILNCRITYSLYCLDGLYLIYVESVLFHFSTSYTRAECLLKKLIHPSVNSTTCLTLCYSVCLSDGQGCRRIIVRMNRMTGWRNTGQDISLVYRYGEPLYQYQSDSSQKL